MWDASHFPRARRVAYAIVDVVTRYWIGYLLTSERSSIQARLLFARALEDERLIGDAGTPPPSDDGLPILVAWSDNGAEMTARDTREFMALMTIVQHHGRPGTPTDQAHVESFFSHLKGAGRTSPGSRTPTCWTASSPASAASTTACACTPRSATSPPTTSTTAAARGSAAPAPPG
jgi:transposase InsO family protein